MNLECKCGNKNNFFVETKGNQKGIYCSDCGKWVKWATKDEIRLLEHRESCGLKSTIQYIDEFIPKDNIKEKVKELLDDTYNKIDYFENEILKNTKENKCYENELYAKLSIFNMYRICLEGILDECK